MVLRRYIAYSELQKYLGEEVRMRMWIESEIRTKYKSRVRGILCYNSEYDYYYIKDEEDHFELFEGDRIAICPDKRTKNFYRLGTK